MTDERYVTLAELAEYSTLSASTLRRCVADPVHPLPAHRIKGRHLYLKSEFDTWLREEDQREKAPSHARKIALSIRGKA